MKFEVSQDPGGATWILYVKDGHKLVTIDTGLDAAEVVHIHFDTETGELGVCGVEEKFTHHIPVGE